MRVCKAHDYQGVVSCPWCHVEYLRDQIAQAHGVVESGRASECNRMLAQALKVSDKVQNNDERELAKGRE